MNFLKKLKKNTLFKIFSLLIILLSLLPRVLKLISHEDYFGGDFGFYYLLTKSIVVDHALPLIGHDVGDIGGFAQGAGWNYLLAIPFILANGNPFGAKVLMFIISVLTVISVFSFSGQWLSKKESLFVLFFLSVSTHLINWSNGVWPPYVVPILTIVHINFIALFLMKKKVKYLLLSTFSLGLMIHFEITSFALIFPCFSSLALYLVYRRLMKIKDLIAIICIFILIFLPHLLYDFLNNFYNIKGLVSMIFFEKRVFSLFHLHQIIINREEVFKTFFTTILPLFSFKFYLFFLIYVLFGTIYYLKDKTITAWRKTFLKYILFIILSNILFLTIFPALRIPFWWFTHITIIHIFLTAIIFNYFWNKKNILHKTFVFVFLILFASLAINNFFLLLKNEKSTRDIKYTIKIQAPIEYIYEDSKNENFKILYVTGKPYVLDYKYMLWYAGYSRYKNSLGFKNLDLAFTHPGGKPIAIDEANQFENLGNGLYYVIITNESIENSYASRLLNNPNSGKLIQAKAIDNNFVVQKRLKD